MIATDSSTTLQDQRFAATAALDDAVLRLAKAMHAGRPAAEQAKIQREIADQQRAIESLDATLVQLQQLRAASTRVALDADAATATAARTKRRAEYRRLVDRLTEALRAYVSATEALSAALDDDERDQHVERRAGIATAALPRLHPADPDVLRAQLAELEQQATLRLQE